jgi:cytochrome P450
MNEATIILATLVSRFRFERIPGRDPEPVLILTLRPEGGVWLRVTPV